MGTGVDNVDLKAAAEAGIVVSNVPDYGINDVADHTWALVLGELRFTYYKGEKFWSPPNRPFGYNVTV